MNQPLKTNEVYLKGYTKETLSNTIKNKYISEKDSVLMRAQMLLNDQYLFQNEWDMERTQVSVHMPLDGINWNAIPSKDMEWSYMFHRHAYLMDLMLAYIFTDNITYINHLDRFLNQYIKENELNEVNQKFSWRTIDVALRLQTWLRLIEVYQIMELPLVSGMAETMVRYRDYLLSHLKPARSQSNWLVIEASALITYTSMMEDKTHKQAIQILELCLENQVLNDGLQWEQSFMYHHEVLISTLHVAKALGPNCPSMIMEKLKALAQASVIIMRPDYTQSNFGDSDYESMGSLMLASEKIINMVIFTEKYPSALYDFMLSGDPSDSEGRAPFVPIEKLILEEAGLSVYKNHQSKTQFMFSNGPLGGGHGHDDYLHIDWMIQGENFLVDSGRYTYHEEAGSRLDYKKPQAHNTPTLNNESYNCHIDSWSSEKVIEGVNQKTRFGQRISYFSGGHFGYSDINKNVYLNRRSILIDDDILITIDTVDSTEPERLTSNYIFPENKLKHTDKRLNYTLHNAGTYTIQSLSNDVELDCVDALISPQYNKVIKTKKAQFSKTITKGNIVTILYPEDVTGIKSVPVYDDNENLYSSETVECYKYTQGLKDAYLLVQHQEPNDSRRAYCVEGQLLYGRLIYVEKVNHEIVYKEKLF